ncbi:hypothetical protein UC8_28240 [Roseimaritima ulvae]|uniref:Uncharacterized protein n=1 Tax=Roseimaritima ulvae TaxID=980254 RepID=A0A5B9QUS2_9BACT|nr:hypothetical protein UC8_28240 [Roseimaritima ulvae]
MSSLARKCVNEVSKNVRNLPLVRSVRDRRACALPLKPVLKKDRLVGVHAVVSGAARAARCVTGGLAPYR